MITKAKLLFLLPILNVALAWVFFGFGGMSLKAIITFSVIGALMIYLRASVSIKEEEEGIDLEDEDLP